jgi:hypothetical protein
MAASEDFNVIDTQPGDIFRDNDPVEPDRTYWIIITRNYNPDNVFMRGYNLDTNMIIPDITFFATLDDLNDGYTYIRRNPVVPINGGKKRTRRSLKGRRTKRFKKKRARKTRKH